MTSVCSTSTDQCLTASDDTNNMSVCFTIITPTDHQSPPDARFSVSQLAVTPTRYQSVSQAKKKKKKKKRSTSHNTKNIIIQVANVHANAKLSSASGCLVSQVNGDSVHLPLPYHFSIALCQQREVSEKK